ncbi:U3 small nucleolar ribonucleoprotein protein MPP10 [Uranotaenia lowii]|uniref:U3 small nucleolar ribonucleoprotein protein MPP10 n=1 Tax=Uranotaenia lowii TaxID=190385 RepID=UPI0024785CC7|nr:U3 small nucleolar ribonucleoprotein protein MPP10 [Uranotaenia lowii]
MVKVNKTQLSQKGLKAALKILRENTQNPEIFLTIQTNVAEKIKPLVKTVYDHGGYFDQQNSVTKKIAKPYLDELVVKEMDEEQIWQQLELKNEYLLREEQLPVTSKLLAIGDEKLRLGFRIDETMENDCDAKLEDNSDHRSEMDEEEETSKSSKKTKENGKPKRLRAKRSIVDDQFFCLEDMARFLDQEDEREMRKLSGKPERDALIDVDYFDENFGKENDSEEDNMMYNDFFDDDDVDSDIDTAKKHTNDVEESEDDEMVNDDNDEEDETGEANKNQSVEAESEDEVERNRRLRFELYNGSGDFIPSTSVKKSVVPKPDVSKDEDSEQETKPQDLIEGEDQDPKSSFELRQTKLQQRIQKMEDQLLQDKPWQLKGEISAETRPQNSLLETIVEFDSATRPAPVITEETTLCLEDIIRQRIKNKAFDDVERKIRPPDNPGEYRKLLVLDAEKSKESLAQIYERDYLKQLEKANPDTDLAEEEEPKEHKEIRNKMKTLLAQLDALSNFHYTPRPAVPELKIITNTQAIQMEEVAPVATSEAALLAPEEVHNRPKGQMMSKDERTRADKNRERRLKKRHQSQKFNRQAEKERKLLEKGVAPKTKDLQQKLLKKVTQAKNVSTMVQSSGKSGVGKSSTAFFSRLQDEVSSQIVSKADSSKKKAKTSGASHGLQATHVKL